MYISIKLLRSILKTESKITHKLESKILMEDVEKKSVSFIVN